MTLRAKLRREPFEERAHERGLSSQTAQADAIGVHKSVHCRALAGERDLGGHYVIGVLLAVGDEATRKCVKELFETPAKVARHETAGAA